MDYNSTPSQASSGTPDQQQQQQHIRLACQACQRKKIKCDRHFPCGQCTRSSLQCVPSTRKPRARHAGKRAVDSELRSRISKLESLVESLSGEVGAGDDSPGGDTDADAETPAEPNDSTANVGKYIGSPFWSSLTTEVQALRDALEDHPDDEDEPTSPSTSSGPGNSTEYDLIMCPPGAVYVMPGALTEPTPELSATLCNLFCENVDSMYKFYHTPTLRAFMVEGKTYFGYDHTAPSNKALKASVWFAAVNTLSDSQCEMLFGQSRSDQLQQFRRLVDITLAQADLLNATDLATLQALVTYMAAARLTDTSRRVWTLTAVAVRIAQAMGLHHESVPRTPFITELRRRLWHQIRFLDLYAALDRGSELLIAFGSYDTPLPKNTNDSEFDESSTTIQDHETGLTDMSYARLAYDATYHTHRLTIPETKATGETWQQRLELAEKFRDQVQERYLQYCSDEVPFQRMMKRVAGAMTASMMVRAIRPMQKHLSSVPPRVDSPYVLQIALNSLRVSEDIQKDPETTQWRWMVWVQWHALAIALAGLCSIRDTDLANEAWIYVEQAYARASRDVADARNGMLWRPIDKLYKKASAFRDHGVTPQTISPAQQTQIPPMDPTFQNSTFDRSFGQLPAQPIPGAMPTGGVLNSPMDLNLANSTMGGLDLGNTDMSWMDFERILEDMSNPGEMALPDMQWSQSMPPGEDWNGVLQQNLM